MSKKTTTAELINAISAATEQSKADVSRMLDGFKAVVTNSLHDGKEVAVSGFGTFKPRHNAARKGRNPRTGEEVDIAPSVSATFKQAKALKDALN